MGTPAVLLVDVPFHSAEHWPRRADQSVNYPDSKMSRILGAWKRVPYSGHEAPGLPTSLPPASPQHVNPTAHPRTALQPLPCGETSRWNHSHAKNRSPTGSRLLPARSTALSLTLSLSPEGVRLPSSPPAPTAASLVRAPRANVVTNEWYVADPFLN
jgi:hypothetical protein